MRFTAVIASFAAAAAAVIGMIRASRDRRHVLPHHPGSTSRGASVYRPSMLGSAHQTEDVAAATVCGESHGSCIHELFDISFVLWLLGVDAARLVRVDPV